MTLEERITALEERVQELSDVLCNHLDYNMAWYDRMKPFTNHTGTVGVKDDKRYDGELEEMFTFFRRNRAARYDIGSTEPL